MEDKNQEREDKKDYKKIYKWDDEDTVEIKEEYKSERKISKKVLKRQAREAEKQRAKGIFEENKKSRITKKGKIWVSVAAVIVVIAIAAWAVFGYFGLIDFSRTLATVDGMRVTAKDVNSYIEFIRKQDASAIPSQDDPQYMLMQQNILDAVIVLKLMRQYAEKNGISISQSEIDQEYAKIAAGYASIEDFEKDIKDKRISKSFLIEQIKDQLLREKIFEKSIENITLGEEEVLNYYNENSGTLFTVPEQARVSHILIRFDVEGSQVVDENAKKEAMTKIMDIKARLDMGEDFAELAEKYSQDTATAVNGGELGFISKGQTVPEFEEAAFALREGEVSSAVETIFGYHLIKLHEKSKEYIKSFEEVKETIISFLLNNKQMEAYQNFMILIITNSDIVYTTGLRGQLIDWPATRETTQ